MKYPLNHPIKITLKTLTPVHVGSGIVLTGNDFIPDRPTNQFKRIAMSQFLEMIDEQARDLYVEKVETGQLDLNDFIIEQRLPYKEKYSLENPYNVQLTNYKKIKEHIKSGTQVPYIPGSTVKGALRTALLWEFAHKDPDFIEKRRNKNDAVDYAKTAFTTSYNKSDFDAKSDLMKFIEVSDFLPKANGENPLKLVHFITYNYSKDKSTNQYRLIPLFRNNCECVEGSFVGSISISPQLTSAVDSNANSELASLLTKRLGIDLNNRKPMSEQLMDKMTQTLRQFNNVCLDKEKKLCKFGLLKNLELAIDQKREQNKSCTLIRLGSEIGTTYQTLFSEIEQQDLKLAQIIVNTQPILGKYRKEIKDNKLYPPYPKTIESTCNYTPLGWCEIITDPTLS
jgi:CRISPR-associated protein Csm5